MVVLTAVYHDHEFVRIPYEESVVGCRCGMFFKWVDGKPVVATDEELEELNRRLASILAGRKGLLGPDGRPISESLRWPS